MLEPTGSVPLNEALVAAGPGEGQRSYENEVVFKSAMEELDKPERGGG